MSDLSKMLESYEVYEETSKQKESCVTKLKRVISLLKAIQVAFLYAFINAIISAIITALYMATDIKLTIKPDFITLISFIVSLLLSSRASNAYNRYIEGHSTWLKIRHTVFNMARLIRINITDPKKRKEYINLLLYFVITLKDYFVIEFKHKRNKDEITNEDENSNGDINVTINNQEFEVKERENINKFMKNINCHYDLKKLRVRLHQIILKLNWLIDNDEANNKQYDETTNNKIFGDKTNSELHHDEANNKQPGENTKTNKKKPDEKTYNKLHDGIDTITECFSSLKKNNLSFPFAYSTLLAVTTWVFSLSLSFQLVSDLQWLTIPIIFLSTLFLFGIIELAEQIENPFGIDIFDADLNKFCVDIWIDTKFIMDNTAEIKEFCDKELDKIKVFEEQNSSKDKDKM